MMKSFLFTTIALLLGLPTLAQTQTQTNCTANGDQINCTSTDNSAANAAAAQQQKDFDASMNNFGAALGTALARKRAENKLYNEIGNNLVYCGSHPDSRVLNPNNVMMDCSVFVERSQAICVTQPKLSFCKKIPATPSASLAVAAPSRPDNRSPADTAEGYCSRNPNSTWYVNTQQRYVPCKEILAAPSSAAQATATAPVSSVSPASDTAAQTSAPAPLTPEQKDAISYCKRNPTATITWNNGTASPCSSVLSPQ